jgi:hypothetical protein
MTKKETKASTFILCPKCNKGIKDNSINCPICGHQFKPGEITAIKELDNKLNRGSGALIGCSIVLFIIIFCIATFFITYEDTSLPVVENKHLDDSVKQDLSWLMCKLQDPGSLEFIEWSQVLSTNDGSYSVRIKYRAKNSFGEYFVGEKVFFFDSKGHIIKDIEQEDVN